MNAEFVERRIQSNGNTTNVNIDRSQPYVDKIVFGQKTRIYGTQEQLDRYQNKKPDGTIQQYVAADTAVTKAFAFITQKKEGATTKVDAEPGTQEYKKETVNTTSEETLPANGGYNLKNVVSNPLSGFATYNSLWTMAVLTPKQFNNPSLYRLATGLSFAAQSYDVKTKFVDDDGGFEGTKTTSLSSGIIFSSGGRDFEKDGKSSRVATEYGTPEYFVDNFEMTAVIAANPKTGNQNAVSFTFTVREPFSMGLFLQSMQVAAIKAGYVNYLDSPFLLKLDVIGFDEDGTIKKSIKPKYFILKLKKVTFNVDESGSNYNVEAYPYNHQGFADTVDTAWTDINIQGTGDFRGEAAFNNDADRNTVKDVLATGAKSLVKLLNDNEQKLVQEGKYKIPDVYEIHFPEVASKRYTEQTADDVADDAGATADPNGKGKQTVGGSDVQTTTNKNIGNNAIAKSGFGFGIGKGGNFPFKDDKEVADEKTGRIKRGAMEVHEGNRSFHFTQAQKLTDIITQVIMSSTFAKQATQKSTKADGMIDWFKIDVQVEFLEYDDLIGDYAKKFIYRVVPFKVHSSIFGNPNSIPVGITEIEKTIVKRYDYIYTGLNTEVLNFEIKIDYLFYTGGAPATEAKTKNEQAPDQKGVAEDPAKKTTTGEGNEKKAQTAFLGKSKIKKTPDQFTLMKGGAGSTDVEQKVAEAFQNAFINVTSADLVKVELEIMGDTYWLVDSGFSNYFAKESEKSPLITDDGTANYEGQDVYIFITFRTPADVNQRTGNFEFNKDKVSPFTGIYRVVKCVSKFADGQFRQTLTCVRLQAQPSDFDSKLKTDKTTNKTVEVGGETKPPTNTSEATNYDFEDDFYI
jgi:hypothetical protein